jgi:hypothetical protein
VDYLSVAGWGVLSTGPANQLGICARFGSWGLLTTAPAASIVAETILHHLGVMNPLRRIVDAFKRIW